MLKRGAFGACADAMVVSFLPLGMLRTLCLCVTCFVSRLVLSILSLEGACFDQASCGTPCYSASFMLACRVVFSSRGLPRSRPTVSACSGPPACAWRDGCVRQGCKEWSTTIVQRPAHDGMCERWRCASLCLRPRVACRHIVVPAVLSRCVMAMARRLSLHHATHAPRSRCVPRRPCAWRDP